jgi:hypothetical protein
MFYNAKRDKMRQWFSAKGYSGTLSDQMQGYFSNLSGLSNGTLHDHVNKVLSANGYSGTTEDMLRKNFVDATGISNPKDAERAFFDNSSYGFGVLGALLGIGGLTFYKDYQGATTLNADYSVGSPTASFTRTTSASNPATYIDSNGVVQLVTTSDVGRYNSKLYDTTGLLTSKRGVVIEAAGGNKLIDTYFSKATITDEWIATGGTMTKSTDYVNPFNGGGVLKLSCTSADDRFKNDDLGGNPLSTTSGVTYTVSALVRSNTSDPIYFRFYDVALQTSGDYTPTTNSWGLISWTFTSAGDETEAIISLANKNAVTRNIYVAYIQVEANPYATTYVPTTTAALTRNAEVLKYEIAGNRTAAAETVLIKFIPFGTFAADGTNRSLSGTQIKVRAIYKTSTVDRLKGYPNQDDSSDSAATESTVPQENTSYVYAMAVQHASPYVNVYMNGISQSTDTADNFTDPAWGTSFFVGTYGAGDHLTGIIQSVTIFNRALTAAEVATVSTLLQNSN